MGTEEMPDSHPMKSGDGVDSYTQNSSYQRGVIEVAKGVLFQAIPEKLDINLSNKFCIADFGCSTGPNTFIVIQNIIDAVKLKYYQSMQEITPIETTPEFHIFFNDHVDNDFNTLFKALPPSRSYFAVGVPGSFYSQLFPTASLHIGHSSSALHWLSRVPPEVMDKSSLAWNKGKIYCAGNNIEVIRAYFAQFRIDMDAFLKARAQELVEGGLMLIQIPGSPNGEILAPPVFPLLNDCLADMVNTGVICEEKLDSFNMPLYFPLEEELKKVIDMNNYFTIEKICTLGSGSYFTSDVKKHSISVRAVTENSMQKHFGSENMDHLYHLFIHKLEKNQLKYSMAVQKAVCHYVILKRKAN